MPAFLERKLRREYSRKGEQGRALARAVYGTMNAIGAMRGNRETAKGRAMGRNARKMARLADLR